VRYGGIELAVDILKMFLDDDPIIRAGFQLLLPLCRIGEEPVHVLFWLMSYGCPFCL
jgi:hypothetical protein